MEHQLALSFKEICILPTKIEPISHPNHSCHTALSQMQVCFTGVKWLIEGDIKGFFDNINHKVMVGILAERIMIERVQHSRVVKLSNYLTSYRYSEK